MPRYNPKRRNVASTRRPNADPINDTATSSLADMGSPRPGREQQDLVAAYRASMSDVVTESGTIRQVRQERTLPLSL